MTNWTTIDSFPTLLSSANAYAPFWTMMLFMMWTILVITFLPYGFTAAILAGSFMAGVIGLLLAYMGLVAFKWVMGLFGIIIAMIIWEALFTKKD
jgi:hypothetical protein